MSQLRLAGFTSVRITSNWRPGLVAPTPHELQVLKNVEAAARLSGVKVYVSVYHPGSRTTPLDATAQTQFAQYAAALARALPSFDDIIVGNEPNLNRFWLPQFAPDGLERARLRPTSAACPDVRRVEGGRSRAPRLGRRPRAAR